MLTKYLSKNFDNYDWVMIGTVLALSIIGLTSLFSTTYPELVNFYKQILWLAIGLIAFFIFSSIDYRLFRAHSIPVLAVYIVGLLGVGAVYFFASPIRGARSWIDLGPFSIEPAEILKIALVLILAKYFSMRHVEIYRIRHIIASAVYILAPSFLVMLQPDMGSFLILAFIWMSMMLVAGIKIKHFMILGLIGVILAAFVWQVFLYDYQKARILSFLDSEYDPLGAGYNSAQSVIAVASGGFWGKGLTLGSQSQLGFLPEAQTDFIYAAIAEEMGLFMALVIIGLFAVFFWRMMRTAKLSTNNFARLTVMGISSLIASQFFLNISMVLGLAPIAGVTLPFISYGGSSLVTLFIGIGIIQSIRRH